MRKPRHGLHAVRRGRQRTASVALIVAVLLLALSGGDALAVGATARASVSSADVQANGASGEVSISANGRFVAFESSASNLVPGDTNGVQDIFVRDLQSGTTSRVSVATGGAQANNSSYYASISGDGRYVVFSSAANNLAPGDTNVATDVFIHDRQLATTNRLSTAVGGGWADGGSYQPKISPDGRVVVFESAATNLVNGDTNGVWDVFAYDATTGDITRVSIGPHGSQADADSTDPHLSNTGAFIVFQSGATNLVVGDTNGQADIYLRDVAAGTTERISVAGDESEANNASYVGRVSATGRYVAFDSSATNLVAGDTNVTIDVFVRDRQDGTTVRVSVGPGGTQANGFSFLGAISGDGQQVVFESTSSNLVSDDTNTCDSYPNPGTCPDVFVHDRQAGTTTRVSIATNGTEANALNTYPVLSTQNGRYVAYVSHASTLVGGDTNGVPDVFVHDREATPPTGEVALQGRTSSSPAAGHSIATVSVSGGPAFPVSVDGVFALEVLADGSYTITACAPGYLCAERMITVAGGTVNDGLVIRLPAGLVDANTVVDILDVTAIIAAFGTRPPNRVDDMGRVVDINGDGVVNLQDLTLTLGNFGKTSPVPWP